MVNSKSSRKSFKFNSLKLKNKRTKKSKVSKKNVRKMKGGEITKERMDELVTQLPIHLENIKKKINEYFENLKVKEREMFLYHMEHTKEERIRIEEMSKRINEIISHAKMDRMDEDFRYHEIISYKIPKEHTYLYHRLYDYHDKIIDYYNVQLLIFLEDLQKSLKGTAPHIDSLLESALAKVKDNIKKKYLLQ